jgi:hypothetical protein
VTPTRTPSPSPQDPATSNLFASYSSNGTSSTFTYTLSSAIYSTSLTISDASVAGYDTALCDDVILEYDSHNSTSISAGSTTTNVNGVAPLTTPYYVFISVLINGNYYGHNQTVTIGGTLVTIKLPVGCNAV